MHRGDQWWWLAETMEDRSFAETLSHSYSHTRTRTMAPGDSQLYRPLFMTKFAVEDAVFGHLFALWQLVGVVLHFLVCWLLHLLLMQLMRHAGAEEYVPDRKSQIIQRTFAYLLPVFVGVNVAALDAVIWAHINGYLVLYVAVLLAMWCGLRNLESLGDTRRHWMFIWLVLALSSFFYEYGQFYGPLVGIFLIVVVGERMSKRKRALMALVFCMIPLLYQSVNAVDRWYQADRILPSIEAESNFGLDLFSLDLIGRVGSVARYTLVLPYIPYDTIVSNKEGRLQVKQPNVGGQLRGNIGEASGVVLMGGWFLFVAIGTVIMVVRRRMFFLACWFAAFIMILLYFLALVIVRVGPSMNLNASSYYIYWPFLLSVILGYIALLNITMLRPGSVLVRRVVDVSGMLFVIWIGVLVVVSTSMLRDFNRSFAEYFETDRRQIEQIDSFVLEHANEPDFSFLFDYDRGDPITIPWAMGIPWPSILFRDHESYDDPHYILHFQDGKLLSETLNSAEDVAAISYLVQPGTYFNVYRRGEKFYGVIHFEGRYSPEQEYRYLIEGASVAEILDREPEIRKAAVDDFQAGRIEGLIELH